APAVRGRGGAHRARPDQDRVLEPRHGVRRQVPQRLVPLRGDLRPRRRDQAPGGRHVRRSRGHLAGDREGDPRPPSGRTLRGAVLVAPAAPLPHPPPDALGRRADHARDRPNPQGPGRGRAPPGGRRRVPARVAMELAPGEGVCEVARRGAGSAVVRLAARSPLRLLTPRNHGGAAWVVTTSYGGGLVDGDALRIALRVGPGAAAYLATQSSTKVYPGAASQTIVADVGDGGLLVSLPDPVVCFAGARYRQDATIRLGAGAGLVWLDGLTAGRAARGGRGRFAGHRARTRIERGGGALPAPGAAAAPRPPAPPPP